MGVMQRALSQTMGGVSPLRTSFVGALIALCLIWSILSLDMSRIRSTVEPVYTEVVGSMKHVEEEAIRIASCTTHTDCAPSYSEESPTVVEVPVETTSNTVKEKEETGEKFEEAKESTQVALDDALKNTTTLVLYAYSESQTARPNLEFFIRHALNSAADFVFLLNGPTNVSAIIPDLLNIRIVQRANDCYDIGAYAEVLQMDDLWKGYEKFIMLNASLRGPFMPYWSGDCWMNMYLRKLTEEVKLVGMTANCWPTFHVQSMIWATDSIGLSTLLFPPQHALDYLEQNPIRLPPAANRERLPPNSPNIQPSELSTSPKVEPPKLTTRSTTIPGPSQDRSLPLKAYRYSNTIHQRLGINACFHTWDSAVASEVSATSVIKAAGYKVDVLMAAYHGVKEMEEEESCDENGDVLFEGAYFGGSISVWETGWWKTNRNLEDGELKMQTAWIGRRGYSSWEFCRA